jgi:hypothetical protein
LRSPLVLLTYAEHRETTLRHNKWRILMSAGASSQIMP